MGGTAQGGAEWNVHESASWRSKNDTTVLVKVRVELIPKVHEVAVCVHNYSPNLSTMPMRMTVSFWELTNQRGAGTDP